MQTRLKKILVPIIIWIPLLAYTQGNVEDLLQQEVENLNPVYKPVIGVGVGAFNFLGDVRNPDITPFNGTLGYKVNVATFLDNNHYVRANFVFMYGSLTGNERKIIHLSDNTVDMSRNLNFRSEILLFGFNLNYDFDNLFKSYRRVHPFVSLGFETFTFDSKTDLMNGETPYYYWEDGSIRDLPQGSAGSSLLTRDYNYETSWRDNFDWGLGKYPQYAFAIPIDGGLDFQISDRVMFRVGTSFHYVFSDVIDHVSYKNDPEIPGAVVGNKQNDNFIYSYFTVHLDLFSSDKTLLVNKFFVDLSEDGYDNTLMGDEDGDGYFDGYDDCPHTPFGVETDTAGCPLDDDYDGIPNYKDDEPNSRYGAFVDERGVEMSEDELIKRLDMSKAVARKDVALYVREPSSYANYKPKSYKEIPAKFKKVDSDDDGYISFDEMMDAIDTFFDFDSDLTTDDIYELNDFFFSQ